MSITPYIVSQSQNTEKALKELRGEMDFPSQPVVLYGARWVAAKITNFLNNNGVTVNAYFVDDKFVDDPLVQVSNVCAFDEIQKKFPRFNVVIASSDLKKAAQRLVSLNSNQIIRVYKFVIDDECDYGFFQTYEPQFQEVYAALNDDLSKKTLVNVLNSRITADSSFIADVLQKDTYFPEDIINLSQEEVFVDGGAYDGDTLRDFIKITGGGIKSTTALNQIRIISKHCRKLYASCLLKMQFFIHRASGAVRVRSRSPQVTVQSHVYLQLQRG